MKTLFLAKLGKFNVKCAHKFFQWLYRWVVTIGLLVLTREIREKMLWLLVQKGQYVNRGISSRRPNYLFFKHFSASSRFCS